MHCDKSRAEELGSFTENTADSKSKMTLGDNEMMQAVTNKLQSASTKAPTTVKTKEGSTVKEDPNGAEIPKEGPAEEKIETRDESDKAGTVIADRKG